MPDCWEHLAAEIRLILGEDEAKEERQEQGKRYEGHLRVSFVNVAEHLAACLRLTFRQTAVASRRLQLIHSRGGEQWSEVISFCHT
jgi:hypothetical protein